jgi:hypothetical protein
VSYTLSSLNITFSRSGLGSGFLDACFCWLFARIWNNQADDTPKRILQHFFIVAYPVGSQPAYCYEAEGKVDER